MPPLTMSSHDKNLVPRLITGGIAIEMLDVLFEALPLCFIAFAGVFGVCGVCAVQKTEVPVDLLSLEMH